ncbi:MAG: hypothetical protein AAB657_01420 [Patescibacteria group bacterium]
MEKAKLGDYVTAKLVGENDCRQGVFIKDNGDGTIIVKGELDEYLCEGSNNVGVVPDKNLLFDDTRKFVTETRKKYNLLQ